VVVDALTNYTVWLGLWPTEERVDTINRYNSFFLPVRRALFANSLLQCARLFDTDTRTISLTNLLKAAKNDPKSLVPHVEPEQLGRWSEQVADLEGTLEKIKRLRDQKIAHLDASPTGGPAPLMGEMDKFLEAIKDIFNELAVAHNREHYFWGPLQKEVEYHTAEVLRILESTHDPRP